MDYELDIKIDEQSLDLEWLNQPALFMKYARHSAQARRDLDEAKQNLDICKAETDRAIRDNPDKYGIVKVTEGAITSAILTDATYKESYQTWLDAKYEADMATGAIQSFAQRKDALENMVRLHGQSYFAGPKVPRDLAWERQEKQKKANNQVGVMKRKNPATT
jgi:hypothetical protein